MNIISLLAFADVEWELLSELVGRYDRRRAGGGAGEGPAGGRKGIQVPGAEREREGSRLLRLLTLELGRR